MSRADILAVIVFSTMVLALVAVRMWGASSLRETDAMLLVLSTAAAWLAFALWLSDGRPSGHTRMREVR
jgi:hypothetical protein